MFTRLVVRESKRRDVPTYAASLAYYAFVSLVPVLALSLTAATWVGGDAFERVLLTLAQPYLLPTGQEAVRSAVRNSAGRQLTNIVAVAVLGWSALRLFRGLDVVVSRVYGSAPRGLGGQVVDAGFVLLSVAVAALGVGTTVAVVGAVIPRYPITGVVATSVVGCTLMAALFPLYYVVPDRDVTVPEAVPGAVFTTVGWTVAATAFGAYAANAGTAAYGLLGGLILLITWFYVASLRLLVGVVLNAALAGRLDATAV